MDNYNEFIKTLKVLYVEDEEAARLIFSKYLKKRFDVTVVCPNGIDAYIEFDKAFNNKEPFDLVISDINMPKMDGIELLEKIREKDDEVRFVFTTARTESENMAKAINYHVDAYLVKPLDFENIEKTIQKICKELYYKNKFEIQKKETEAYLSFLNKEAIVTKTDIDGNITFANDAFYETTGFTEDEAIGKNHNIVRHPDNPTSLFKDIWDTIKAGKIWEGRIKNLTKNKETYYINTKIIPIFSDNGIDIKEFLSIRFIVTDEEILKRQQNKRFFEQISQYKKEISKLKNDQTQIINKFQNIEDNTQYLKERNLAYENKIKNLLQQLNAYEQNNLEMSKMDLMMKKDKTKQFEQLNLDLMKTKTAYKALKKELEDLRKIVLDKEKHISELELKKEHLEKRIRDLVDLVSNLQKELKELKGEDAESKEV